jgi:hypothetical protein
VSPAIRRLRRGRPGEPAFVPEEEGELLEEAATDQEAQPAPVVEPDGRISPRFSPYRQSLAGPPASEAYRRNPGYMATADIHGDTRQRATQTYRQWLDLHAAAQVEIVAWLATNGHLGPDAEVAYRAYSGHDRLLEEAQAKLKTARAREVEAKAELVEAVRRARAGEGELPAGGPVLTAELEVRAAELVAQQVKASQPAAGKAWGDAQQRADWAGALAQVRRLSGDAQAERAARWLRGRLDPPVGPDKDPLRWVG